MEAGAYGMYMAQDETAQAIAPDEHEHGRTLARLQRPEVQPVEAIAGREKWHRTRRRRHDAGHRLRRQRRPPLEHVSHHGLRRRADTEGKFVLLAGVSGLLAGAFSMAAGEYVSMRAQRELFERQIALEKGELEAAPAEEQEELALIYQAKGLPRDEAESMAARLMENPQIALETLVREELGLDPGELGSPWGASIGSFLAFAVGALVPVIPFLFGANASLPFVIASAGLATLAAFAVGASLSLFTGRHPLLSGGRQVALGAIAAALTFAIGRVVGVSAGV